MAAWANQSLAVGSNLVVERKVSSALNPCRLLAAVYVPGRPGSRGCQLGVRQRFGERGTTSGIQVGFASRSIQPVRYSALRKHSGRISCLKRSSPRHWVTVAAELLQHPKSLATHRLSIDLLSNQDQSSLSSCPTASSISSCFKSRWTLRKLSQSQAKRLKSLSQMAARSFFQMCMQLRKPICSRTDPGQLQTSSTLASWCSFTAFV